MNGSIFPKPRTLKKWAGTNTLYIYLNKLLKDNYKAFNPAFNTHYPQMLLNSQCSLTVHPNVSASFVFPQKSLFNGFFQPISFIMHCCSCVTYSSLEKQTNFKPFSVLHASVLLCFIFQFVNVSKWRFKYLIWCESNGRHNWSCFKMTGLLVREEV